MRAWIQSAHSSSQIQGIKGGTPDDFGDEPETLTPTGGFYSKDDFIRMWETPLGGAASDKNEMHFLLSDSTETSADCGTNQMQNLLQIRCGTI